MPDPQKETPPTPFSVGDVLVMAVLAVIALVWTAFWLFAIGQALNQPAMGLPEDGPNKVLTAVFVVVAIIGLPDWWLIAKIIKIYRAHYPE